MSITFQEMKHFMHIVDSEGESKNIGTVLYEMGQSEESADPVKDIKEIRSGD